jgi:hypothetical protein
VGPADRGEMGFFGIGHFQAPLGFLIVFLD